jgi:hypothetical protein
MKNILLTPLLALSFLIINCSGSDDNLPNNEQEPEVAAQTKHFHPPLWIQGVWHTTSTPVARLKFTQDDIISLIDNSSLSDQINKSKSTNLVMAVENEGIGNTLYYYTLTNRPTNSNLYSASEFRVQKINDTLMFRAPEFSNLIYYVKEKN